jgi:hypothetical protein
MAKQIIGIGTVANDGTGDSIRVAMGKVNDNFNETYQHSLLKALNLMGSDAKAYPLNMEILTAESSFINMTDNVIRFSSFYIPDSCILTGLKFILDTQGNFTADNFNGIGLYKLAGTMLTLVAESANDPNYFKVGSGTLSDIPFTAPYTAAPGIYYVAYLANWSAVIAAPKMYMAQSDSAVIYLELDVQFNCALLAQNTLPANYDLAGIASQGYSYLSWLY